jgi:predicted transcriptional regulator of viral defense system
MDKMISLFNKNHGYLRMKDIKNAGIHTRRVAEALREGYIEKIKPGLYKLIDYPWDEYTSFLDISKVTNKAVICLASASAYYGLTTFNPSENEIAVPHNTPRFNLEYPPVKVYYFPDKLYEAGIKIVKKKNGTFKVYNMEKTIADLFRYRNKIGEDIVIESLKNYLSSKNKNINRLLEFAEICNVKKIILPYIKAVVG